jgi:cytochrome c-type biogenesis protein CcmE
LIGVGILGFLLLGGEPDYFSVDEAIARAASLRGETISVRGVVTPGSISWDEATSVTAFSLSGDGGRIEVTFPGVPEDSFSPGVDLLVVGTLGADGAISALHLREPNAWCGACH